VHAMGSVTDESFRAAWRDARIVEARAVGGRDLDRALALLSDGGARPGDPLLGDAARALIVGRLDDALDRRDVKSATVLVARARAYGVGEHELAPREHRLRLRRLTLPLGVAGVVLLLGVAGSVPILLRRRRGRRA